MVGITSVFPFGILADVIGRKPVMFLSTIGSSLSLAFILAVIHFPRAVPVEFILAGPLFTVLGGGSTVLVANLYSILSDVVAPAERTSAFFSWNLQPFLALQLAQPWPLGLWNLFHLGPQCFLALLGYSLG